MAVIDTIAIFIEDLGLSEHKTTLRMATAHYRKEEI
jgi:hypothetical protein